jgi:hypothetical protein
MVIPMKNITEFPNYCITPDGRVWSKYTKKFLKPSLASRGYYSVSLMKDGIKSTQKISRLVLSTYAGRCPDGYHACHINGNRTQDHIYNLRWDSPSGNSQDAIRHGTHAGFLNRCRGQKLSIVDIKWIRENKNKYSQQKIAELYNVDQSLISRIINNKVWVHC